MFIFNKLTHKVSIKFLPSLHRLMTLFQMSKLKKKLTSKPKKMKNSIIKLAPKAERKVKRIQKHLDTIAKAILKIRADQILEFREMKILYYG